jgi:hypothetical protein
VVPHLGLKSLKRLRGLRGISLFINIYIKQQGIPYGFIKKKNKETPQPQK